jgi:hypothetical protein
MTRIQQTLTVILFGGVIWLWAFLVQAQTTATPEKVSGSMNWILAILVVCAPVLTAAITWASVKFADLIKARTKNELIGGILARLTTSAFTLVREAEQTAVAAIKAARDPKSPGGEELTKEEGEQIKKAVVDKLKEVWGVKGLHEAGKILGLTDAGLDKFISAKVEEAVFVEKRTNP